MMQMRSKFFWLMFLWLAIFSAQVYASEENEQGKIVAVQSRKYQLRHEFNFSGGVLPLDAFAKGLTIGGNYTYHVNDFWGIEIINFQVAENFDTGLKDDLQKNFGVSTTQFNLVQYLLGSSIVVKPVYGKLVFFNRAVLPGEVSLMLGGGVVNFDDGVLPALDAGLLMRVWLNKTWSVRVDARDYYATDGDSSENVLFIGLGLSINVGGN
jgi:outer membrane beta-barrel protein